MIKYIVLVICLGKTEYEGEKGQQAHKGWQLIPYYARVGAARQGLASCNADQPQVSMGGSDDSDPHLEPE